jgi:drug/metabolite transporter (DMT)-like permease
VEGEQSHSATAGILVEVAGAMSMAVYFVVFQRWGLRKGDLPPGVVTLIAGAEGLAHLLLFWVLFVVLDYTRVEKFEWPSSTEIRALCSARFFRRRGGGGVKNGGCQNDPPSTH